MVLKHVSCQKHTLCAKEGSANQQHVRLDCWRGQALYLEQKPQPVFPAEGDATWYLLGLSKLIRFHGIKLMGWNMLESNSNTIVQISMENSHLA